MQRPQYETELHLAAERECIEEVQMAWNCVLLKLPKSYRADYLAMRDGRIVGWVEVKCRSHEWDDYEAWGGYMISLGKAMAVCQLAERTNMPACLIVSACKDIRWSPLSTGHPLVRGGRKDRKDDADIEPCLMIPTKLFKGIFHVDPTINT